MLVYPEKRKKGGEGGSSLALLHLMVESSLHISGPPIETPTSGRGSRTRPDAHFRLTSSTGSCKWEEINCTGEFKKGDSADARDDVGT